MTTIMVLMAAVALAVIMLAHATRPEITPEPPVLHGEPHRSVEHAARILAGRYARGEISVDEYQRTLLVLNT